MHKPEINKGGGGDYSKEPLPEGTYECIVKGYEAIPNKWYHGEPYITDRDITRGNKTYKAGDEVPADPPFMQFQYQWTLEVADGPHEGRWLWDKTSTVLSKGDNNKLRKFLGKIVAGGLEEIDSRIDADDAPDFDTEVIGMPVICVVEKVKSKTSGNYYNKVSGYLKSSKEVISIEDAEDIQWEAE